jgi:hypothetical protein
MKEKFGKTSEMMEGFCFITSRPQWAWYYKVGLGSGGLDDVDEEERVSLG